MDPRTQSKIAPIQAFRPLLLIIRLHGSITLRSGLPDSTYPKTSKIELVLPHLLLLRRNINLLPFRAFGVTYALRIG